MTVWVVGNSVWDTMLPVAELPQRGETVLTHGLQRSPGGKGANQAVVAQRFGANVHFVTALGTDDSGNLLGRTIMREGLMQITAIPMATPTDESWIVTESSGENVIISTHQAISALDENSISEALAAAKEGDLLVLQGNTTPAATKATLRMGRAQGLFTIFNPAPARPEFTACWPFCDLVILNQSEAAALLNTSETDAAIEALIVAGAGAVVLTLGAGGAQYRDAAGQTGHIRAQKVAAVDTAGAGDTLAGALISGLATGVDLPSALKIAMAAAALTVTRHGTFEAFPTAQDAIRLLAEGHIKENSAHREGKLMHSQDRRDG